MKNLILLLVTIMLLGADCRKPHHDEGFYFRCKVNGQEYIPNGCANCRVAKLLGDTTLLINGNRGFESLDIGISDNPIKAKVYKLDQKRGGNGLYDNSSLVEDIFKTDSSHAGKLIIMLLDRQNQIITGKFYFKAYNSYRNDSVNITDGIFRLKYNTN